MRSKMIAACAIVALAGTPALAAGDAAAGLQSLKELNLTVLGTLTANGQEVEGRTFAGALVANNFTNFGIGRSNQGSATSADYGVLDVVANATGSWRLKAGYANGSSGLLGNAAVIGGNVSGGFVDFNDANGQVGSVTIGGDLTSGMNVNNHSVTYGGVVAGGINGAVHDASLAAGGANDVHAALTIKLSDLTSNLTALSDTLFGLSALSTITGTSTALDYSGATNGYAVFTMTEAAFEDQNANFDNLFASLPNGMTTIINVLGTNLVEQGNVNSTALNQSVIWNFHDANSLSLKGFHGSVLAVNASVSNSSAIEGSIVAKDFTLNGEVHLGTFAGTDNFLTPPPGAVPEPASWAMMLTGFGAIGALVRRRRKLAISFG